MPYTITIDNASAKPKYRQIVDSIITGMHTRSIGNYERLPSINQFSTSYDVSRDTVEKAYRQLKRLGIIISVPGKGYFAVSEELETPKRLLLLFSKLSAHKKVIYDSFVRSMGNAIPVDLKVYHEDCAMFKKILRDCSAHYTDFVVMPSFRGEEALRCADLMNTSLAGKRLWVLNAQLDGLKNVAGSVYQNFEKDIYGALTSADSLLKKYRKLVLVFPSEARFPSGILRGFNRYSQESGISSEVVFKDFEGSQTGRGTAYIVIRDEDLVALIRKVKQRGLEPGQDVGILAYNDSPLKEVLLDGITVISTDHALMGEQMARLVTCGETGSCYENAFGLIKRSSL